jgi:hypothetical protein
MDIYLVKIKYIFLYYFFVDFFLKINYSFILANIDIKIIDALYYFNVFLNKKYFLKILYTTIPNKH